MTIEPTEEQKQAAYALCKQSTFVYVNDGVVFRAMLNVSDVARLLAERVAKLRAHCVCIGVEAGRGERDALRGALTTMQDRLEAVLSVLDPEGDRDTDLDDENLRRFVRRVLDAHVAGGEQGAQGEIDALKEELASLRAEIDRERVFSEDLIRSRREICEECDSLQARMAKLEDLRHGEEASALVDTTFETLKGAV